MPGMKASNSKPFKGFKKNASLDNLEDIKVAVEDVNTSRYTQPKYNQPRPVEQAIPQYQPQTEQVEFVKNIFDRASIAVTFDNSIEKFYVELSNSPTATAPYIDKMPDFNDTNLDMIMSNVQQHMDINGLSNRLPNDVVHQYKQQQAQQNQFWNDMPNGNNGLPNYETSRKTSLNMEVI